MQYLGVTDPRFGHENFGDQPSWLIFAYLEFYTKKRKEEANISAAVHARGWSGLFNGFGGTKSRPIEPWQLMPFPEEAHPLEQRISQETIAIVVSLISRGKVPSRIIGVLCTIEEISIALTQAVEDEEE